MPIKDFLAKDEEIEVRLAGRWMDFEKIFSGIGILVAGLIVLYASFSFEYFLLLLSIGLIVLVLGVLRFLDGFMRGGFYLTNQRILGFEKSKLGRTNVTSYSFDHVTMVSMVKGINLNYKSLIIGALLVLISIFNPWNILGYLSPYIYVDGFLIFIIFIAAGVILVFFSIKKFGGAEIYFDNGAVTWLSGKKGEVQEFVMKLVEKVTQPGEGGWLEI